MAGPSLLGKLNCILLKVRAQNFPLPGAQTRSFDGVFLEAEKSTGLSGWHPTIIYNIENVLKISVIYLKNVHSNVSCDS